MIIDANGFKAESFTEILTRLSNGLKNIYGQDINLDQDSPDGQQLGIQANIISDFQDLALYIDNSYDVQLLKYIEQLDLLPRPQGVEIRTVLHFADGNTFGFRRNKEALGFSRRLQGGLKPKFAKKIFI